MAGKHARHPPITIIERWLEAVFSVGAAPRLYNEDPMQDERVLKLGGGQV
jgi:hypothetical protein